MRERRAKGRGEDCGTECQRGRVKGRRRDDGKEGDCVKKERRKSKVRGKLF